MEVAERIGKERFYKYFEAYGFTEKTGIDLAGEVSGLYHTDINGFNQTELAVYSFGQTFKITPMQQICGVSAVANGGNLLKPHVVKALVDDDGNVVKSFDTTVVRKVNSEETSKTIMTYLMNGINIGSNKNAYVKGYKIAAKTGTSQKRDKEGNYYIGSCVAFAPADDPQIAILGRYRRAERRQLLRRPYRSACRFVGAYRGASVSQYRAVLNRRGGSAHRRFRTGLPRTFGGKQPKSRQPAPASKPRSSVRAKRLPNNCRATAEKFRTAAL